MKILLNNREDVIDGDEITVTELLTGKKDDFQDEDHKDQWEPH